MLSCGKFPFAPDTLRFKINRNDRIVTKNYIDNREKVDYLCKMSYIRILFLP